MINYLDLKHTKVKWDVILVSLNVLSFDMLDIKMIYTNSKPIYTLRPSLIVQNKITNYSLESINLQWLQLNTNIARG